MRQTIRRLREWLAKREVRHLEAMADDLPSQGQAIATEKRIRYCERHLREGINWRFSKQIMEVRHLADKRLQLVARCVRSALRAMKFDPKSQLSDKLASRVENALGTAPSDFDETVQSLRYWRKRWTEIVLKAGRVRNPLFASQAFFRMSEYSRIQITSFVIGSLIASGAVQMLFFYRAAAKQFVFAYWVWDDLVIQAINVVPIALIVLTGAEIFFRVLRWGCEKLGRPRPVLFFLDRPTFLAFSLFLLMMFGASLWGYHQGISVWHYFSKNGGMESATMMDQTYLTGVHLVGTTSRTAVFLQAKPADTENGDNSQEPATENVRQAPYYSEVFTEVLCAQPFPWFEDWCKDKRTLDSSYRVYVMDRDKIVCHAEVGQCEQIPYRKTMVTTQVLGDVVELLE